MSTSRSSTSAAPVVAFLSHERKPYSRMRFEEEAPTLGLATSWLDPKHFDLLVDSTDPRTFYRSRSLVPPAAFVPRTGSDTTMFSRAIVRQFESTPGVAVINSSGSIVTARDTSCLRPLACRSRAPCWLASHPTLRRWCVLSAGRRSS